MADNAGADWRKATFSNGQASCVEVGTVNGRVAVRDTKQRYLADEDRTAVPFDAKSWRQAVTDIKNGNRASRPASA